MTDRVINNETAVSHDTVWYRRYLFDPKTVKKYLLRS